MEQIIALGGGGFSMEPDNLALDRYILEQTKATKPKVCFLGQASAEHRRMHGACVATLEACETALRPGQPIGQVFDAHARSMDEAGYRHARLNACGYSLGTTYTPCWMDWPMFHHGNPVPAQPGMVFFLHMILMDSEAERAMTLGHTVLVTEHGCERLNRAALDLVVV